MASLDHRLNPLYAIKECSSCGNLHTKDCSCSKGSLEDKILVPVPDLSQRPLKIERICLDYGDPVHGLYCRQCALIRKTLEEVFQDFQDTSESSDDDTNFVNQEPFVVKQGPGVNSSQSPPQINHNYCYECGDLLDGIFCQRCTCKSCGKVVIPIMISNNDYSLSDDDSYENIDYVDASPPDAEIVSLEVVEIVIPEVGGIDDDILLTIKDDTLREKLLNVNLLIANIEALKDNPAPSSDVMTKSSSTSLNLFLEETNTFDNSSPESETFCFDLEENKKSSGSTTTHAKFSKYNSFIFDLSINPFPPTDRSDFYHEEFTDELAHIISPLEYDCFCFKNEPERGDFTMDVVEDIFPTREPRVHVPDVLPTHPTLDLDLDFILLSEPLFAYIVWIFIPFLTYPVAPPYLLFCGNEDTIFDPRHLRLSFFYAGLRDSTVGGLFSTAEEILKTDERIAQKLNEEEMAKAAAREEHERIDFEKALELLKQLDEREETNNIEWSIVAEQNMAGYKMGYFKGISYDEIRPMFEEEYNKIKTLFKKDTEVEKTKTKRVAEETLLQESFKKLRTVEASIRYYKKISNTQEETSLGSSSKEEYDDLLEEYGWIQDGLTEKDYPLSTTVMGLMLSRRLQVEEDSLDVSLSRVVGFLRGTSVDVVILVKGHAFPTIMKVRPIASNWLERLPAGSITTWEDLTTRFLAQFFPPGRTEKLRNDILMFQQHHGESLSEALTCPNSQPQALGTTFEARVRDYMVAHTGRMKRFENAIFKQHEEINDRMTKMFGLLKELTTNRAPEKEEVKSKRTDITTGDDIEKPTKRETKMPVKETEFNESLSGARVGKLKGKTYNLSPRGPVYEAILRKKITRKEDIGGNFKIPSEDILVEVAEHVYPVDFVILDIKEDEKRPFILGTPFLTKAKAVIKFDKGTITLRSGKILEWEERIKLHLEREMEFNRWKSKNFKGKHPTLVIVEGRIDDEGEVT
ncbi:reverse transcriptase domain-containing protein [Tanacetum coccineum]